MRAYANLNEEGIITNKRGIGFFVPLDARMKIKEKMKQDFLQHELPLILDKMRLLDIDRNILLNHLDAAN